MNQTPRIILDLLGIPQVSESNITITGGTTPDTTIKLSALNGCSALVSETTSCTFDVYSIGSTTLYTPDNINYLCSNGDTDGDGNNTNLPANSIFSFRDQFLLYYHANELATKAYTTSEFVAPTGGGNGVDAAHCHFVVTGNSCESFDFNGDEPYYFQGANGNNIENIDNTGIQFTCGANDINYKYDNFDVYFENNCSNPNGKSYLVFTPKSGTTGLQKLGDGQSSIPFYFDAIDKQTGDFYLTVGCNTSGTGCNTSGTGCNTSDVLFTALKDVVFGLHSYN